MNMTFVTRFSKGLVRRAGLDRHDLKDAISEVLSRCSVRMLTSTTALVIGHNGHVDLETAKDDIWNSLLVHFDRYIQADSDVEVEIVYEENPLSFPVE